MRQSIKDWLLIGVPTILALTICIILFYVVTDFGFISNYNGYTPMYAPLWFEALVTTLFIPFMVGFSIYDRIYGV